MLLRVVWWKFTGVSDEFLARLTHRPDEGGSMYLWNVDKLQPDYMELQHGK
jgi:hypothetical protein